MTNLYSKYIKERVYKLLKDEFDLTNIHKDDEVFYQILEDELIVQGVYIISKRVGLLGIKGPWISNLVISPRYRRQGIATKMLKEAINSRDELYLWSSEPLVFPLLFDLGFKFVGSSKKDGYSTLVAVFKVTKQKLD
ncbi:MAG: GNAT family N-acetyltransferase [Arcobacter sp.]|nr:GNAT family N-acetyltransferase [Flavobacteriaceae bacterium]MCP4970945.1 GNAT family N-acetyltransferase [Arcobacter sp.]